MVPTTLIVGADDPVTRGTSAGDVHGQPQLSVRALDSVAHWIPEQRPQAVIDWVEGR
jgi:pimeloyl-ACP methyl ester carboxylesterase